MNGNLPSFDAYEHPLESAAEHVVTRIPLARLNDRVEDVLDKCLGHSFESFDAVYVVDENQILKGAVRLHDLFAAPRGSSVERLLDVDYPRVKLHWDQERVVAHAIERRATTVAVVDDQDRLVGAVPALSLLDILRREHVEDLHRLAGIQRETARTQSAFEAPPARRVRHRLPWLLVGLAGSLVAAAVFSRFERVLESKLTVAFFVPMVVYVAAAIGTQTEAIAVRGLSLSRLPLRHLLFDELRTGLLIGLTLGAISFPIVALGFDDMNLGLSVAFAILIAGTAATSVGLLLPWALQRLGTDPAFGSGPVATIIQDVLSLVIYLALAMLLMG